MKATALALSALLILPLLATGIGPAVMADEGRSSAAAGPNPATSGQPSAAPVDTRLSGPQPFITILCKFADEDDEPKPPAYFEGLLAAAHPGLSDYWREVSYGQINLQGSRVVGWYTLPRPVTAYRPDKASETDLALLADDCIAAADVDVHFPDFVGINLMFNLAWDNTAWGGKRCLALDGQQRCFGMTWLSPRAFAKHSTVAHEIGHTFGLHHSSAGRGEIYRNLWDVMSASRGYEADPAYGALSPHTIAYDKDRLGWIPADRKFIAAPQGVTTIELGALADPASKGYLMVQVPIAGSTGRFYTVEARIRVGYDTALPADAVLIHEVDPTRDPPAWLVNHRGDGDTRMSAGMWAPGDVFIDAAAAVAVSVDGATATGFVVTIATGPQPWPLAPVGIGALPPGDVTFAWQPVPHADGYEVRVEPQASQPATGPITRTVTTTETTIFLPPGAYLWQVRALPAGQWTLPVRVVAGFGGRRWLPSEAIPAAVGRIHSGLIIAAEPKQGVSVAWVGTEGMFHPVSVRAARRGAAGWQLTEQIIPDYDLQVGPIPVLALDPQGEACGLWVEHPPTLGPSRVNTERPTAEGLWFDCWPRPQSQIEGPASTENGDVVKGNRSKNALRVNPDETAVFPFKPALILDRAGVAYAVWNGAESGTPGMFSARRPPGKPWEPAQRVAEGTGPWALWSPAIAGDDRGGLHAIWADTRAGETGIYAATRTADGRWSPSIPVSDLGMSSRINPTIAVDGQGNTYAAWHSFHGSADAESTGDIEFARQPAGGRWERSVLVSSDIGGSNVSTPVIAASPEGALYLVWEEKIEGRYALFASYRPAGGAWEPKTPLPDSAGNQAPAQPALAVDAAGNVYVTWLDTRDEQPVVRFVQTVK